MEKVLLLQNKHWKAEYKGLYGRNILNKLQKNLMLRQIEVIQGIRRCGKSTIFKLLINELMKTNDPKEILYVNLDDPFFISFSDKVTALYDLLEISEKLTSKKVKYLFLDEIQNIKMWEKFVKSIYDNEVVTKIFITGSNSSLLNSEYASLLSGRYLSNMVYPLTYTELLKANKITELFTLVDKKVSVLNLVDDILKFGLFPEIVFSNSKVRTKLDKDQKREILKSYYDTIILKDCIMNNQIRDIKTFRELCYFLLSNNGATHSFSSLSKIFNIQDKSIKEYLSILESSFIINEVKQFSFSLKEQNRAKKKIYLTDNGFSALSFSFSENKGRSLESLVFCELKKVKNNKVFFYDDKNFECDFIVKDNSKTNVIKSVIQVCWELNDNNLKRELNGIKKLQDDLKPQEKVIITYNQEKQFDDGIKAVPFWKYFSGF